MDSSRLPTALSMMETTLPDEGAKGDDESKGAARTCVLRTRARRLLVNFILANYLRSTRIFQEIDVGE